MAIQQVHPETPVAWSPLVEHPQLVVTPVPPEKVSDRVAGRSLKGFATGRHPECLRLDPEVLRRHVAELYPVTGVRVSAVEPASGRRVEIIRSEREPEAFTE